MDKTLIGGVMSEPRMRYFKYHRSVNIRKGHKHGLVGWGPKGQEQLTVHACRTALSRICRRLAGDLLYPKMQNTEADDSRGAYASKPWPNEK